MEDFQIGKDAFDLDHSQVRTYLALLRHLVLAMAALAICAIAIAAATAKPTASNTAQPPSSPNDDPPAEPGLIPLTVVELKRLVNLIIRHPHLPQPRTPPALAHLETTSPSPRPLVPPTNPPNPLMTSYDCRTSRGSPQAAMPRSVTSAAVLWGSVRWWSGIWMLSRGMGKIRRAQIMLRRPV